MHKPFQELLSALYLTKLKPQEQLKELKDIFGDKSYEMVWVFYAGITRMEVVSIEFILDGKLQHLPRRKSFIQFPAKNLGDLVIAREHCYCQFMPMITSNKFSAEFLLTLILCCYEAKNESACKCIAAHVYPDVVCRIEIPQNSVSPYLLLAVSYFIAHSGKKWSLRCNASIQSGVELLCKYIINQSLDECSDGGLWVWCYVVKTSQIDAYCEAIKSQSSLQWIHLLNGSCLGDEGTIKLCECLTYNCLVMKVEMENCKIGSIGLKSFADMLNINRNILHIDLRKNCFSLQDTVTFLNNIKNQMHLEYLLLDQEFCQNSEVISMLEELNSIRRIKNTKELMLSYVSTTSLALFVLFSATC